MPHESVARAIKQLTRRAALRHPPVAHDDDAIGESQGLGLVVSHINHREIDPPMQPLQKCRATAI